MSEHDPAPEPADGSSESVAQEEGTSGPEAGSASGWRARTLRWAPGVGAAIVVVAMLAVGGAIAFDRSLDRVDVDGLAEDGDTERQTDDDDTVTVERDPEPPSELGSALHVLVAGSDDRSVLSPEEQRELRTGDVDGERMEALALVRIDPDTDRVDALRLPRDLLVTRCDGSRGRINAAYAIGERDGTGGSSCLVETITTWTGIPIHHVVRVDFRGFVDAVDAVGGVEVPLDEPLEDERAGLDVPEGCVHLDGADALAFVRARQLDDDFGRIDRQQQLVAATMDQVLTRSTLRDPRRLGQLLTTAQRSLELDSGLTPQRLRSIAATVADLEGEQLVTRTVDGEIGRSDEGIAFLYPDESHADALFDAFADGSLPDAPEDGSQLQAETATTSEGDGSSDDRGEGEPADDADEDRSGATDEDRDGAGEAGNGDGRADEGGAGTAGPSGC